MRGGRLPALLGAALVAGAASAQTAPPPARGVGGGPPPAEAASRALSCEGLFGPDATHARLVEAFGPQNVVFEEQPGPEGETYMATVLFPKRAADRLVVTWKDEKRRAKPEALTARSGSRWALSSGLKPGSTLAEVEAANGKPFTLSGFDWDYGGFVTDWRGGALAKAMGPCVVGVRFEPGPGAKKDAASGDAKFQSNGAPMRAARPVVSEITLTRK